MDSFHSGSSCYALLAVALPGDSLSIAGGKNLTLHPVPRRGIEAPIPPKGFNENIALAVLLRRNIAMEAQRDLNHFTTAPEPACRLKALDQALKNLNGP